VRTLVLVCMILQLLTQSAFPQNLTQKQKALLAGARSCLGARYDASYYTGGPPPIGRGACTDVLYYAFLRIGIDLQSEVDRDSAAHPASYREVTKRDRNIDYRRCPNLVVWLGRFARPVTTRVIRATLAEWEAGDVVIWSLKNNGDTDHCGIVSDRKNAGGIPLVIHNFPPACTEDDVLLKWQVTGHYRY
jgi:uncharacterized protein